MFRSVSSFISYAFHPLLMPVYAMILLFNLDSYLSFSISDQIRMYIYATVFISTFLLPALFSLFLLQKGMIRSLQMEDSTERKYSFLTGAVFYFIGYMLLKMLPIPKLFPLVLLGANFILIAAMIVNRWWKISIHTMGIGGLAGIIWTLPDILYINIVPVFTVVLLLAGAIGSARLYESSHNAFQVYAGFFAGFIIEVITIRFLNS